MRPRKNTGVELARLSQLEGIKFVSASKRGMEFKRSAPNLLLNQLAFLGDFWR